MLITTNACMLVFDVSQEEVGQEDVPTGLSESRINLLCLYCTTNVMSVM